MSREPNGTQPSQLTSPSVRSTRQADTDAPATQPGSGLDETDLPDGLHALHYCGHCGGRQIAWGGFDFSRSHV